MNNFFIGLLLLGISLVSFFGRPMEYKVDIDLNFAPDGSPIPPPTHYARYFCGDSFRDVELALNKRLDQVLADASKMFGGSKDLALFMRGPDRLFRMIKTTEEFWDMTDKEAQGSVLKMYFMSESEYQALSLAAKKQYREGASSGTEGQNQIEASLKEEENVNISLPPEIYGFVTGACVYAVHAISAIGFWNCDWLFLSSYSLFAGSAVFFGVYFCSSISMNPIWLCVAGTLSWLLFCKAVKLDHVRFEVDPLIEYVRMQKKTGAD